MCAAWKRKACRGEGAGVAERICVARIGAAHGIKGEVKLWSFTADPAAVKDYGPLESEDGTQRFEIEALRPAKDHLVARLSGVRDRDAAQRLTNVRLFVARERLPAPAPEEFYHADLIGLRAAGRGGPEAPAIGGIPEFGRGHSFEFPPAGASYTR